MQVGDVYRLYNGAHMLVLRLNVDPGRHLFREWFAGEKKAQKDRTYTPGDLDFYGAVLVGKNCVLRSHRRVKRYA